MGRLLLAGALMIAALRPAHAGPTREVKVSSEPAGASVYLNDVDGAPVCEPTPCSFKAPIGSSLIIIKRAGYEPEMQELDVPKGKAAIKRSFQLTGANGKIRVDGPRGAAVRVDNEDRGKAPVEVEIAAGEHHVVVVASGKNVFDDEVDVEAGKTFGVKAKTATASAPSTATNDPAGNDVATVIDDDDDETGNSSGGSVSSSTDGGGDGSQPAPPRGKIINVGIAFDLAVRSVTYAGSTTPDTLRELGKGGQGIVGPAVEVWPGRILRVKPLRGLSVFARYQVSPIAQPVGGNELEGAITSKWSSFELSLRERIDLSSLGLEFSGGYVMDRFAFTASQNDFDAMPDTNYQSIRLGLRVSYAAEGFEPYLNVENRIVMSGGVFEQRFEKAEPSAIRGALGFAVKFGSIAGRVEGAIMRYSWVLDNSAQTMAKWQATGASDTLLGVAMTVGYSL